MTNGSTARVRYTPTSFHFSTVQIGSFKAVMHGLHTPIRPVYGLRHVTSVQLARHSPILAFS